MKIIWLFLLKLLDIGEDWRHEMFINLKGVWHILSTLNSGCPDNTTIFWDVEFTEDNIFKIYKNLKYEKIIAYFFVFRLI